MNNYVDACNSYVIYLKSAGARCKFNGNSLNITQASFHACFLFAYCSSNCLLRFVKRMP